MKSPILTPSLPSYVIQVVTAWVALTPSTSPMGCVSFLPGSHTQANPDPNPNSNPTPNPNPNPSCNPNPKLFFHHEFNSSRS